MSIDEEVGKVARAIRQARGINVDHMAEELGVQVSEIEAMEAGRRRMGAQYMIDYCRALHVPISTFFEWQGDRLQIASVADRAVH